MAESNGIRAAEFRGKVLAILEQHTEEFNLIKNELSAIRLEYEDHVNYHKRNEHKWGFWTLLKRRPIIALLIGAIISGLLIKAGIDLSEWLRLLKITL